MNKLNKWIRQTESAVTDLYLANIEYMCDNSDALKD